MFASLTADAADDSPAQDALVVAPPGVDDAQAPLDAEAAGSALVDPTDVPDNSADLSVDVDRWVLHDVLQSRLGQTDAWEARYAGQATAGQSPPAPDWTDRLAQGRTEQLLRGGPAQHHEIDTRSVHFDIPLMSHPLVDLYIDYFTGRGRWMFERWLNRASAVVPLMQPILRAHNVPEDMVYLAMIESGFSPHAYSTAAASGYWQFMAPTGRLYGLYDDIFMDERRDFVAATQAAARYLSSLKRQMGSWHLAWASYNAGEGRIRRALRETQTSTFWELIAAKNNLAKETVHYVPKVIAAAIVAKDATRYGFRVTPAPPITFDEITVKDALDVTVLAKQMRVPPESLRALNPALLHDITPPGRTMTVRVPQGMQKTATVALARLPPQQRLNFLAHVVRPGDTLSHVARRMGSSVAVLRQFNHMGPKSPLRVGQRLIVPSYKFAPGDMTLAHAALGRRAAQPPKLDPIRRVTPVRARASNGRMVLARAPMRPRARHVVSSGDTLWSIAKRYKVTLSAIKGRTTHRSARLAVGEVLEIF